MQQNKLCIAVFFMSAFCALFVYVLVFPSRVSALTPLQTFSANGSLAPAGADASGTVAVNFANNIYEFTLSQGGTVVARYEIDTQDASVARGLLKIKETAISGGAYPLVEGGPRYRTLNGAMLAPAELAAQAVTAFSYTLASNVVTLSYAQIVEGNTKNFAYEIELRGKTMVVRAHADNANSSLGTYAGFSLGRTEQTPSPRNVAIPYMNMMPLIVAGTAPNQFFSSAYIDFTRSNSNKEPIKVGPQSISATSYLTGYMTEYISGETNVYPALNETAYITVSPDVPDTFIRIHRSPSAYRNTLNDRVVWDFWGSVVTYSSLPGPNNVFGKLKSLMELANFFRMDKIAFILHQWQGGGYDCRLPEHAPANTNWFLGGESLRETAAAAASFNYLFALHENYTDIYPNTTSEYWISGNIAKNPDGSFRNGWLNTGCTAPSSIDPQYAPSQAFKIASDKMSYYANQESPQTKNYGTSAAYLDITTSEQLSSYIDYASANSNARTLAQAFGNLLALNSAMHAIHQGPLLGEGGWSDNRIDTLLAGSVDGVEREIPGREFAPLIPDFELREVKPLMASHGMGYPARWINSGAVYQESINPETFYAQKSDKYRAMEIAFGHAGFITDTDASLGLTTRMVMREYHLLRELQPQYLGSTLAQVLYRNAGGVMVDLSQAIKENLNFGQAKIYQEYTSGLKLYLNFGPANWTISANGQSYTLPPYGWVAWNQNNNYLAYSALVNGSRADYVRSNNYIMADARGVSATFPGYTGTFTTDAMRVIRPDAPNEWVLNIDLLGNATLLDTAPPLVSLTAPVPAASVVGAIALTAQASDPSGIAGVQFTVDGSDVGAEDVTAPYTVAWDTAQVVNGAHTIRARARDTLGNVSTSPLITVTVANAILPQALLAPTSLSVNLVSPLTIRLAWIDASANEISFVIERRTGSGVFVSLATTSANVITFDDATVGAQTTYTYRVRAWNATGYSLYSNTATITTPGGDSPPLPPPPLATSTFTSTLARGSNSAEVRVLQEFLARDIALYPEGTISGYFGALTEAAVKRFQTRYAIGENGIVGPFTRAKLNALYTVAPPSPPQGTVFTLTLRKGMTHPQITLLQQFLARDSSLYPEGTVSGYFGSLTERAVQRFQAKYGIVNSGSPSTTGYGSVGVRTRLKLNERYGAGAP